MKIFGGSLVLVEHPREAALDRSAIASSIPKVCGFCAVAALDRFKRFLNQAVAMLAGKQNAIGLKAFFINRASSQDLLDEVIHASERHGASISAAAICRQGFALHWLARNQRCLAASFSIS